jgi:peptidoglycan/LPS O-acetylase OafA/YrhL
MTTTPSATPAAAVFEHVQFSLRRHMSALDSLRGLAILAVVFHNVTLAAEYVYDHPLVKVWTLAASMGWIGVQLFFVISGFLITGLLLDGRGAPRQLRNFYMRRMLRIFPLYYTFLLVAFILLPAFNLSPGWLQTSQTHQVWYWTYLVNWAQPYLDGIKLGHFWSLAVEEQFYIVWPLLVIFLRESALVRLCIGLIASALIARGLLLHFLPNSGADAAYMFTIARWDALAIGALVAIAIRDKNGLRLLIAYARPCAYALTMTIALLIAIDHSFGPVHGSIGIANQTIIALLFGLIIALLQLRNGSPSILTNENLLSKALSFFGKYSYAIYVLHIPIKFLWLQNYALPTAGLHGWPLLGVLAYNFAGVLLLSTAAALLSWHIIERPFLNLKQHFSTNTATTEPKTSNRGNVSLS